MKRALVTGGCGFIGSNLTKELVNCGWQVDIVDNMSNGHLELLDGLKFRTVPNASFVGSYYAAYENANKVRPQEEVLVIQDDFASDAMCLRIASRYYDNVFHLAAVPRVSYSVEHPYQTTHENIAKTTRLFEVCIGAVDRIIFSSSSSIYGGAAILPTPETMPKLPKSPYAWHKAAIEDFAKICWDLYKLDVVCLRYFNVFGPGQYGDSPYSTAVSAWCHAIKNDLECRSDGDGEQTRDMCYVDNVVQANIKAANFNGSLRGECYNVACGDKVSNNEVLEFLKGRFGDRVKVKHAPERPGDVKHTKADLGKINRDLDYEVKVRFWEGLERTLEWWGLNE